MKLEPTLHGPIPMKTRVRVDASVYPGNITGTVVGISFQHIIFGYIVLLDQPIIIYEEVHDAISVSGPQLFPVHLTTKDWHLS